LRARTEKQLLLEVELGLGEHPGFQQPLEAFELSKDVVGTVHWKERSGADGRDRLLS